MKFSVISAVMAAFLPAIGQGRAPGQVDQNICHYADIDKATELYRGIFAGEFLVIPPSPLLAWGASIDTHNLLLKHYVIDVGFNDQSQGAYHSIQIDYTGVLRWVILFDSAQINYTPYNGDEDSCKYVDFQEPGWYNNSTTWKQLICAVRLPLHADSSWTIRFHYEEAASNPGAYVYTASALDQHMKLSAGLPYIIAPQEIQPYASCYSLYYNDNDFRSQQPLNERDCLPNFKMTLHDWFYDEWPSKASSSYSLNPLEKLFNSTTKCKENECAGAYNTKDNTYSMFCGYN